MSSNITTSRARGIQRKISGVREILTSNNQHQEPRPGPSRMNTPPQPDVQPEMSRKAAEPSPPQPEVRPGVTKNDRAKRPRLSQLLLGDR